MPQKLSAMTYIKNNKRRVSVLIVSLALCFALVYLTSFLLSSISETFGFLYLENTLKCQFIGVPEGAGITDEELAQVLSEQEGILHAFCVDVIFCPINPPIGGVTYEIACTDAENISILMEHFGASLKEGRLPENPGEMVLDEASMRNNDFELNGYFAESTYQQTFTIVGVLDCDTYFGCAYKSEYDFRPMICTLSDGSIPDMSVLLDALGYGYSYLSDRAAGEKFLQAEVTDAMASSTRLIYIAVMLLLAVSLFIVYTMYLRDRHDEWCLFCSIGFSRGSIYFSVLRELLFTFAAGIAVGGVIIACSEPILNLALFIPMGVKCRYFDGETLGEILCSYVLLLGLLQIPVRCALYKVRTVDAIEDDLY